MPAPKIDGERQFCRARCVTCSVRGVQQNKSQGYVQYIRTSKYEFDRFAAVAAGCMISSCVVADNRRGENNWTDGRAERAIEKYFVKAWFSMHLLASARRSATPRRKEPAQRCRMLRAPPRSLAGIQTCVVMHGWPSCLPRSRKYKKKTRPPENSTSNNKNTHVTQTFDTG